MTLKTGAEQRTNKEGQRERERESQWVDDTQDWGRAKNQQGRSERERVSGLMTLKTGAEQRTNEEGQRERETVG